MAGIGRFIAGRIAWAVFLLFVATLVTYVFFWIVPADPATFHAASQLGPAEAQMMRHYLHLDQPVWKQYLLFLWNLLHGSLGHSLATRQSVASILGRDAPVTGSLVLGASLWWLALAIPIGVLSALRRGSVLDRGTMTFVVIGLSAPSFWIGLVFSYVFGFRLAITPIAGYCNFFAPDVAGQCSGPAAWAYHLVLPWATFTMLFAALYARLVRASVLDTISEDYVRTARAKGAGERRVLTQHVLRNCALPIVTILGMDLGLAITTAALTETVFSLPGLGAAAIQAYSADDEPVIIGIVMFSVLCVVTLNLLVDIAYSILDPRIRLG